MRQTERNDLLGVFQKGGLVARFGLVKLFPPWGTEGVQGLNYTLIGLIGMWLAFRGTYVDTSRMTFGPLEWFVGRQELLGLVLVALGVLGIVSLFCGWDAWQRRTAALGAGVWATLSGSSYQQAPGGVGGPFLGLLALSLVWSVWRLSMDLREERRGSSRAALS